MLTISGKYLQLTVAKGGPTIVLEPRGRVVRTDLSDMCHDPGSEQCRTGVVWVLTVDDYLPIEKVRNGRGLCDTSSRFMIRATGWGYRGFSHPRSSES